MVSGWGRGRHCHKEHPQLSMTANSKPVSESAGIPLSPMANFKVFRELRFQESALQGISQYKFPSKEEECQKAGLPCGIG